LRVVTERHIHDHDQAPNVDDLWRDDRHWRWNLIYACKEDPRPIVLNRWRFGWTWNFGHPHVFGVLAVVMLVAVGPAVAVAALGWPESTVIAVAAVSFATVIWAAHRIASRT
jgi:uncharacterized membrane protein